MEIDFVFNATAPITALAMADKQLKDNIKEFVNDAGERVEAAVKEFMPVFSGEARDSIDHTVGLGTVSFALIYTNDDQAKMQTIENSRGTDRRPPPASALLPWVRKKGYGSGDMHAAIMLAKRIGERGSHNPPEGHRPFGKAAEQQIPILEYIAMDITRVF